MKKRILFLSPYPLDSAPSQRLKYEQYYPHFEEAGYECITSSFVSPKFWRIIYQPGFWFNKAYYTFTGYLRRFIDLFRLRQFDIVYVHLWVTPIGLPLFEWLVVMLSKNLIYDIDDLVYLNDQRKHNKVMLLIRGRTKPIILMRKANHVICCTPRLEEFVKNYNTRVTDISSTINTDIYRPKEHYAMQEPFVIGWSGSHSTSRYLHLLDEVFQQLAKRYDFILKVIGDPDFDIPGVKVKAIAWSSENEVEELREFDIGVYPLPLDEEWVYGKSGLKALQYMALGIPTVATAIGANYRVIDDGVNGILVMDDKGWVKAIDSLIQNREFSTSIAVEARKTVQEKFSVTSTSREYLSIILNL